MKGVLPWLVRWACRASRRDFCPALAALARPSSKYFFPHRTYSNSFVPIGPQAGQAAGVLGHLSISMCLCSGVFVVFADESRGGGGIELGLVLC
jgi:hypothetical protein